MLCHLETFDNCRYDTDINILHVHYEKSGSLVKRPWIEYEWRERLSQWVQCSAQHVLALHATPSLPISHSIHFLPLYLPQLLQSHPPHPHTSLPYPTTQHVDGDREIGKSTLCVCVCEESCPSQPLAPPGDRWGDWTMWLISDDIKQMLAFSVEAKELLTKMRYTYS